MFWLYLYFLVVHITELNLLEPTDDLVDLVVTVRSLVMSVSTKCFWCGDPVYHGRELRHLDLCLKIRLLFPERNIAPRLSRVPVPGIAAPEPAILPLPQFGAQQPPVELCLSLALAI